MVQNRLWSYSEDFWMAEEQKEDDNWRFYVKYSYSKNFDVRVCLEREREPLA